MLNGRIGYYLDGNGKIGETCYGKPWLVLKELFGEIKNGVSIFELSAAGSYLVVGQNLGNYATFIIFCYVSTACYHVFKVNDEWHMEELQTKNYITF